MKIGIIGIGAIGSTIAKKLAAAGHDVKVTSTAAPNELAIKATELNAMPATIEEVVKEVDVIFLSIPIIAIPKLPNDLFKDLPSSTIIVDTTNYYPFRDGEIDDLKNGKIESEWVSEQIGQPVIKAFNNLLAHTLENLGISKESENRIAMAIAGNDENAKEIVKRLISETGFNAVDAGQLPESWRQQPGTPTYCTELNATDLQQALADGVKENAAERRDFAITKLMSLTTVPTHPEIIELNRSLFPKNPKNK